MEFKTIFHIHTRFSKDSMLPLFLLRFACKIRGINCICITDHNEIAGALKFKDKYEHSSFKVIVGEEIFTTNGEIIGLYLKNKIPKGLSPMETIQKIRDQDGLVIVPHPFEVERRKTALDEKFINEYAEEIDAMEFFNGRNFKAEYSQKQTELCEKYGITKILGSDAHTIYEIGFNTIVTGSDVTKENFTEILKTAKFHPRHMPRIIHYITKAHKLCKLIFRQGARG